MPFWNKPREDGITHTDSQGRVQLGRGPEPKEKPVTSYKSTPKTSFQVPVSSGDPIPNYQEKMRIANEKEKAREEHQQNNYDAQYESSLRGKPFLTRKSDAQWLAELVFKESPNITKKQAGQLLHPDLNQKYRQQANDALAILNTMIVDRDKRK